MRRLILGSALSAGLLLSPAAASPPGDDAITSTIERFAKGGAERDRAVLESVLHDDFRVVFTWTHEPGVSSLDRATYLGLIDAGKLGGVEATVTMGRVVVHDQLATAEATLLRTDVRFDAIYTLVRDDSGWRIVQDAVAATRL